jgi:hypothetical protein
MQSSRTLPRRWASTPRHAWVMTGDLRTIWTIYRLIIYIHIYRNKQGSNNLERHQHKRESWIAQINDGILDLCTCMGPCMGPCMGHQPGLLHSCPTPCLIQVLVSVYIYIYQFIYQDIFASICSIFPSILKLTHLYISNNHKSCIYIYG